MKPPKSTHSGRTIPLPDFVIESLRKHQAQQKEEQKLLGSAYHDQNLVFCTPNGTPIWPENFSRAFQRLLAQAGIPKIRLHGIRHTFATYLLNRGASLNVVAALLGHSNPAFTAEMYGHTQRRTEWEAINKIEDLFSRWQDKQTDTTTPQQTDTSIHDPV